MFEFYKEDGRIKIKLWGMKIIFKNPFINRLEDCCAIENLKYLKKQGTNFPHPVGIVVGKGVEIGKNCTIFQNVTIGKWNGALPKIGDNVKIYANSVIYGDTTIGNNAVIGAGSVVTKSVPDNAVVVGNPAKIVKYNTDGK